MTIEFTNEEIQLLFNLINQVNWSGQQIELAYELKKKVKEAIESGSIKVKKIETNQK